MAGATITKTTQLLRISRGTVSKVMTAYEKECKTSSAKHKSGHSSSLFERDRRTLNCIVKKDLREIKTIHRELHTSEFYGRAAIKNPFSHRLTLLNTWSGAKDLKIGPLNSGKM